MKTQFKRFSKSTLAIVLAVCMLVSCLMVGIVATDAAKKQSEAVAAQAGDSVGTDTYYYRGSLNSWGATALTSLGNNLYYYPLTNPGSSSSFKITNSTDWSGNTYNSVMASGDLTLSIDSNDNNNVVDACTDSHYIVFDSHAGKIWAQTENPEDSKVTIYVKNDAGWGTVKLYLYDPNNEANAKDVSYSFDDAAVLITNNSPSTTYYSVTDLGNGIFKVEGIYKNKSDSKPTKMILHNGSGTQKYDEEIRDGYLYTTNGADAEQYETMHPVTVNIVGSGSVSVNGEPVENGETVQVGETTPSAIEAVADSNNHFVSWTVSNLALTENAEVASNSMTASDDGILTATFAANVQYNVNVVGGTADKTQAYEGETVTLTYTGSKIVTGVNGVNATKKSDTEYQFTMPAEDVTATFTDRDKKTGVNVTVSSNNTAFGTVSCDPSGTSFTEGDTVTVTANPLNGCVLTEWRINGTPIDTLSNPLSYVVGESDAAIVAVFSDHPEYPIEIMIDKEKGAVTSVDHERAAQGETVSVVYTTNFGYGFDKLIDVNGNSEVPCEEKDGVITFTMPGEAVYYEIRLKDKVSDTSTYKYYGYDVGNERPVVKSGYNGLAFKESYYGTNENAKFSFIKIDRAQKSTNESFLIENTAAAKDVSTIYYQRSDGEGTAKAVFYDSNGKSLKPNGETQNSDYEIEMTNTQYKPYDNTCVYAVTVPPNAASVKFNYGGGTTNTKTLSDDKTYYYGTGDLSSAKPTDDNRKLVDLDNKYAWNNWKDDKTSSVTNLDVYNTSRVFGSNFYLSNTNFFFTTSDGNGKNLLMPNVWNKEGMEYYLIVYYPGVNYGTVNGVEIDLTKVNHPVVVAQTAAPGEKEDPTVISDVRVIAKDGAIRRYGASRNPGSDMDYSTFEKHADTILANEDYSDVTDEFIHSRVGYTVGTTYDYAPKVAKGTTLHIKTTVDNSNYYVKAFSINGVVYQLHDYNSSNVYTEDFTIPEDWKDDYVEITPIYYYNNDTPLIRFSVQGYDESVMNAGWGNTLYVYPYWEDVYRANNAFGGYPGQPMIFYKGEYYIEIPETCNGKTVKGMTLNNGYWDDVHLCVAKEVNKHHQTYDYDDFYKIYKEYPKEKDGNTLRIICSFKFRTARNNDEPGSIGNPAAYTNGWEILTNYEGKPVDLFGLELNMTPADAESAATVRVISQDYKDNCAGHYATEWAVYNNNNKVTRIIPSALVINENNIKAQQGTNTLDYNKVKAYMKSVYSGSSTDAFADEYVALDDLRGKPVLITYEQSIWGGHDPAERCDARWYWSYTGTPINAQIRVKYSIDGGVTFNLDGDDPLAEGSSAPTTGANVSFGGEPSDNQHTASSTIGGNSFELSADKDSGQYKFVGWYAIREGVAQFVGTDPQQPDVPASSNVTFEARYVLSDNGGFTVGHLVHPKSVGKGTAVISAQLKQDGTNVGDPKNATNGSVKFDNLEYGKKQTIEVSLQADPEGVCSFENFYGSLSDLLGGFDKKAGFISNMNIDNYTKTATFTITVDKLFTVVSNTEVKQTVFSQTSYSKFGINDVTVPVNIEYVFPTRYYGEKVYILKNIVITKEEILSYFANDMDIDNLTPEFVLSRAPFESIYRHTFVWNTETAQEPRAKGVYINGRTATVTGEAINNPEVIAVVQNGEGDNASTETYTATYMAQGTEGNFGNNEIFAADVDGRYFQYWKVYKLTDMDNVLVGENINPVAICYSKNFNYSGYEDYYVVAVYGDEAIVDREAANREGMITSASLLTVTRSHWNTTLSGNADSGKWGAANADIDRVYVDFVLCYQNGGKMVSKNTQDNFGFALDIYDDGDYQRTVNVNIDKTKVDSKNRIEYAYGIANTAQNTAVTRSYVITPTINGVKVNNAVSTTLFSLYEVSYPQAEWAK